MTLIYYLGDVDNRHCLSTDYRMELIGTCHPLYFDTEDEAIDGASFHGLIVHSCIVRFYLADRNDRFRLAITGQVEAANNCIPLYFTSEEAAKAHPEPKGLTVFACPVAETIPGLPKDAVCAETVQAQIEQKKALREMALEVARLCRL